MAPPFIVNAPPYATYTPPPLPKLVKSSKSMAVLPPVIAPDAGTELVSANEPSMRIASPEGAGCARARSMVWPARSSVTATPEGTVSAASAAVAATSRERTTVPPAARSSARSRQWETVSNAAV